MKNELMPFDVEYFVNLVENENNLNNLKEKLVKLHDYEIALIFEKLDDTSLKKIITIFSNKELGEILSYIDNKETIEKIENFGPNRLANIINTMEPDDAVDLIQEFDHEKQEEIINLLELEQKKTITKLIAYEEKSAGSIMNPNYIAIQSGNDIKKIMKEIIEKAPFVESIRMSYVIDEKGKLLGTLDLKKVIKTKSPTLVEEIMDTNFKYVEVNDSIDYVTNLINKYDIYDLPVLENGILKGIITMDDAFTKYASEALDDYVKFSGATEPVEIDAKPIQIVKTRIPWLILLLFTNLLIALIISRFDYIFKVDTLAILVFFQPLIIGLAGNCGTQSLGVTISEITKNELNTKKNIFIHTLKEITLGISLGVILAIITSFLVYIVLKINPTQLNLFDVITTISISMLIGIIAGNLCGTIVPILFYKIKIDPAAASGPLITTIIDVVALIIYYVLATILLYNKII